MQKRYISLFNLLLLSASTLATPLDLLNEYNLVVFNDLTTTSEVEGRTMVMGDIKGTSNYGTRLSRGIGSGDALIVGGSTSDGNIQVEKGYNAVIAGSNSTINLNGGGSLSNDISAYNFSQIKTELTQYSSYLSTLASNSTLTASNPNGPSAYSFDIGKTLTDEVAIFDIAYSDFFTNGNIQQYDINFNGKAPSSIVINVSGKVIDDSFAANAVGNINSDNVRQNIIWNFYEATEISLDKQLNGSLLAPLATLTNTTPIKGSVVVDNFVQNGEVHDPTFSGITPFEQTEIPEPNPLLIAGLLLLSTCLYQVRKKRK